MKVLAVIANADIRNDFQKIISEKEECTVTFLSPYTNGPAEVGKEVTAEGFDFIIYDFGPSITDSVAMVNHIRKAAQTTPILVFGIYDGYEEDIKSARCAFFNWKETRIWSVEGKKLLLDAVAEARCLVL